MVPAGSGNSVFDRRRQAQVKQPQGAAGCRFLGYVHLTSTKCVLYRVGAYFSYRNFLLLPGCSVVGMNPPVRAQSFAAEGSVCFGVWKFVFVPV